MATKTLNDTQRCATRGQKLRAPKTIREPAREPDERPVVMVWLFKTQIDVHTHAFRPTGDYPVRRPMSVAKACANDGTHEWRAIEPGETQAEAHTRCVDLVGGHWQWRGAKQARQVVEMRRAA